MVVMAKMVDINIWDRAEATARADHPHATDAEVQQLAEAFQQAYEDWADEIDLRESFKRQQRDAMEG